MARVALLCPDLLFGSKLRGALSAAGHEVVAPDDPADVQVVDLTAEPEERLGAARTGELPTLAFYSHVEVDVRRQAEEAAWTAWCRARGWRARRRRSSRACSPRRTRS